MACPEIMAALAIIAVCWCLGWLFKKLVRG
jgi:hypothetical protein